MLSGRGLCDGLIIRSEESYRLWRVVYVIMKPRKRGGESPLEGCKIQPAMGGCSARRKKNIGLHLIICLIELCILLCIMHTEHVLTIVGKMYLKMQFSAQTRVSLL